MMRLEGAVNAGAPIKLLSSFGWDVRAGARLREQPWRRLVRAQKLEPPKVLVVLWKAKVQANCKRCTLKEPLSHPFNVTHVFSKHHFNSPPKSEWTGISKFHTVYFAPSMLVYESVYLVHSGIEDDV